MEYDLGKKAHQIISVIHLRKGLRAVVKKVGEGVDLPEIFEVSYQKHNHVLLK